MPDIYDIALAGLLHDIGKVMQRAGIGIDENKYTHRCPEYNSRPSHKHVMWTEDFFFPRAESNPYMQEIANLASSHHKPSEYKNKADPGYLAIHCLVQADRVSAAWDRQPEELSSDTQNYKKKQLRSIFNDVSLGGTMGPQKGLKLTRRSSSDRSAFPVDLDDQSLKTAAYNTVFQEFKAEYDTLLAALDRDVLSKRNFIDAVDSLLERFFWSVPSNTMEAEPSNSLYYHSRSTAGIAAALYAWYSAHPDEAKNLENLIASEQRILMLVGGDLSGIQKYLYDLHPEHSRYAAKTLRARSFTIRMFSELVLQRICHDLDLPRQCVLMNAGGKFMLIAPALPEMGEKLEIIRKETEAVFFREFLGTVNLNLSFGDGIRFRDLEMKKFPDTLDGFIEAMEQAKCLKFSTLLHSEGNWHPERFIVTKAPYHNTLCPQCGKRTVPAEKADLCCPICDREIHLGEILPKRSHYLIGKDSQASDRDLIRMGDWYLRTFDPKDPAFKMNSDMYGFRIREEAEKIDIPYPYLPVATSLPRRDSMSAEQRELLLNFCDEDVEGNTLCFDELALLALNKVGEGKYLGVPLNAVLRGDVDGLGNIFTLGLRFDSSGKLKSQGFSITQYATLSAAVDWFFSAWLPALIDREERYRNKVYTVYAGGDDFCLIGPWDTMLDFAQLLRDEFQLYCGQHPGMHFSAALYLMHGKTPVRFAVERAGDDLDDKAKKFRTLSDRDPDKNAIHLFDTTVPWNDLPKLMEWNEHFDGWLQGEESERGFTTQFLYRLMQYSDMAVRYQEKQEVKDLLYKSYLTYDLKRNFKEGSEPVEKLQALAWQDELIRKIKVPIHKTIYSNRKYKQDKGEES